MVSILSDKYTVTAGSVYLTGIQALVRLPRDQQRRDAQAGLRTGAFITGYEGSPLAGYDLTLARTGHLLKAHNIVHQPAVNEELGATAMMGSQLVHLFPGPRVAGVNSIWYGKGPGVDRCGDIFKHADCAGTRPHSSPLMPFLYGPLSSGNSQRLILSKHRLKACMQTDLSQPSSIYDWIRQSVKSPWLGDAMILENGWSIGPPDIFPTAKPTCFYFGQVLDQLKQWTMVPSRCDTYRGMVLPPAIKSVCHYSFRTMLASSEQHAFSTFIAHLCTGDSLSNLVGRQGMMGITHEVSYGVL
jgi:hypothetical protein